MAVAVELDKCVRRSESVYDKYSRTEAFWFSGVPSLLRSQTFSYVEAKHPVWKNRSLPISINLDHVIRCLKYMKAVLTAQDSAGVPSTQQLLLRGESVART